MTTDQRTPSGQKRYPMNKRVGYGYCDANCERCNAKIFIKPDDKRAFCQDCMGLILKHSFLTTDWADLEPMTEGGAA